MKNLKKIIASVFCLSLLCTPFSVSSADDTAKYGDLNSDGAVDLTDMTCLSLHILGDMKLDDTVMTYADVTADDEVNLADLAHFKQYISKEENIVLGKTTPVQEKKLLKSENILAENFETQNFHVKFDDVEEWTEVVDSYEDFTNNPFREKLSELAEIDEKFFDENILLLSHNTFSSGEHEFASSLTVNEYENEVNLCLNISIYANSTMIPGNARLTSFMTIIPKAYLPENKTVTFKSSEPYSNGRRLGAGGTILNIENGVFTCSTNLGYMRFTIPDTAIYFIKKKADEYQVGDKIRFSFESITTGDIHNIANNIYSIQFYTEEGNPYTNDILLTGKVESINDNIAKLVCKDNITVDMDLSDTFTKYINTSPSEIKVGDELIITCSIGLYLKEYEDYGNYLHTVEPLTEENIPIAHLTT